MEILLIEGDLELLGKLSHALTHQGHTVNSINRVDEGLSFFKDNFHMFDVIITNIDLKGEGLKLLERIQKDKHEIPVIAMTDSSKIDVPMKLIEYGVFEIILKPFDIEVLYSKLNKLQTNALSVQDWKETLEIYEEKTIITIPSRIKLIRNCMIRFRRYFSPIFQLYKINGYRMSMVFEEALANAIVHGNLDVSSTLRENSWAAFDVLRKERESNPAYFDKKVKIIFELSRSQLDITIADEGKGFDYCELPDPNDPANILSSGRGILIIRKCMDKVSWNGTGNTITMTKYLKVEDQSIE